MFYEFAIIQCPISQLYMKHVCEQYFNHVQASEGNGEIINGYFLKEKYQAFDLSPPPPPHMLFAEKTQ